MQLKTVVFAGGIAATLIAAPIAYRLVDYLRQGSELMFRDVSPDGSQAVELHSPSHWLRLTSRSADMPVSAREIDLITGTAGPWSPVFELSGQGKTFWLEDGVQIGSSAIYDRSVRRWTINE